jgi:hypothetical protein
LKKKENVERNIYLGNYFKIKLKKLPPQCYLHGKSIIVIPNPLIPHVREIITRAISTPIIPLIVEMTTIALLVEKTTTIIIPNGIIPHARKLSIITQQTKITTTIIIAIAILSHGGKITITIVP